MYSDTSTLRVHCTVVKTEPLPDPDFKDKAKRKVSDLAWKFSQSKFGKTTIKVAKKAAPVAALVVGLVGPPIAGWFAGVGVYAGIVAVGGPVGLAIVLGIWFGVFVYAVLAKMVAYFFMMYMASKM